VAQPKLILILHILLRGSQHFVAEIGAEFTGRAQVYLAPSNSSESCRSMQDMPGRAYDRFELHEHIDVAVGSKVIA
jgi:hypothetical protein